MTPQELAKDRMDSLREEFADIWNRELAPASRSLGGNKAATALVEMIAWKAFLKGRRHPLGTLNQGMVGSHDADLDAADKWRERGG